MSYVDLNPIRAGLAPDLESSSHTSVRQRISRCSHPSECEPLLPVAGTACAAQMPASLVEYLVLTDWTGRNTRPDKRGTIATDVPSIIQRLGLAEHQWRAQVVGIEKRYWRAVGAVDALIEKARAMGQCWLKGVGPDRATTTSR